MSVIGIGSAFLIIKASNTKKAIESFNKTIELEPEKDNHYYWLGNTYYKICDYEEAIKYLSKAIEINQNSSINYKWLGMAYYTIEKYKEASENLLKSSLLLDSDFETWRFLGNSYLLLKDYYNAFHSFEKGIDFNKGIEINSNNDYILKVLGIDINDSSAIVVINDSSIFNNYGVVLANLNRIEEAKKYFEKALEINPNNEKAKDNLNNLNSYLDINLHIQK